jgi:hypothetical protein
MIIAMRAKKASSVGGESFNLGFCQVLFQTRQNLKQSKVSPLWPSTVFYVPCYLTNAHLLSKNNKTFKGLTRCRDREEGEDPLMAWDLFSLGKLPLDIWLS